MSDFEFENVTTDEDTANDLIRFKVKFKKPMGAPQKCEHCDDEFFGEFMSLAYWEHVKAKHPYYTQHKSPEMVKRIQEQMGRPVHPWMLGNQPLNSDSFQGGYNVLFDDTFFFPIRNNPVRSPFEPKDPPTV